MKTTLSTLVAVHCLLVLGVAVARFRHTVDTHHSTHTFAKGFFSTLIAATRTTTVLVATSCTPVTRTRFFWFLAFQTLLVDLLGRRRRLGFLCLGFGHC
jgi:hypothetical protein